MLSRVLLFIVLAVLTWSGIHPADRFTWWLEVAPVLIGLPIVILTNKRFPLTPLLQVLLTLHAIILMAGRWNSKPFHLAIQPFVRKE